MKPKRILFITGTRADYGKMKPLMRAVNDSPVFRMSVYVCGMHLDETFGSTYQEVINDHYRGTYVAYGLPRTRNTGVNLGNTITSLTGYVENFHPDMIVVHGDRMEALAGAIAGALHNIMVAHIEGGELSGTIDESIRHAISKFAHVHFACTEQARTRLIQLGEDQSRIYVIGSPDIDIMMSDRLPSPDHARKRYDIPFTRYGILMYHPVTTEYDSAGKRVRAVVDAVLQSSKNYVVIYPNNDLGSEIILNEYRRLSDNSRFRIFPSLRFEYFLTLLKNADFMLGNSSAGVRECGVYGVPAIDVGSRQSGRYAEKSMKNIRHTAENTEEILTALSDIEHQRYPSMIFGQGDSTERFMKIITESDFWNVKIQKHFVDFSM